MMDLTFFLEVFIRYKIKGTKIKINIGSLEIR